MSPVLEYDMFSSEASVLLPPSEIQSFYFQEWAIFQALVIGMVFQQEVNSEPGPGHPTPKTETLKRLSANVNRIRKAQAGSFTGSTVAFEHPVSKDPRARAPCQELRRPKERPFDCAVRKYNIRDNKISSHALPTWFYAVVPL